MNKPWTLDRAQSLQQSPNQNGWSLMWFLGGQGHSSPMDPQRPWPLSLITTVTRVLTSVRMSGRGRNWGGMWKTRKKPYSRIAEPPETGACTKRGHHQQRVRIGSNFSAKIASLHTRKTGMAYLIHSCKYMWTVPWNKDLLAVSHEKMYFKISSYCCLNVFLALISIHLTQKCFLCIFGVH